MLPGFIPIFNRGGAWTTLVTPTLNADDSGFSNLEDRFLITSASLAAISGTQIRITCTPPTTGTASNLSALWVGMKGASAPDYNGNQVQLKVGGSSTITLTAGGAAVLTDAATFTYTSGNDLIIGVDYATNGSVRVNEGSAGAAYTRYSWNTSGHAGDTSAPVTPSTSSQYIFTISKIEIS